MANVFSLVRSATLTRIVLMAPMKEIAVSDIIFPLLPYFLAIVKTCDEVSSDLDFPQIWICTLGNH